MQIIKKIRSNFNSLEDVTLFVRICTLATVLPVFVKLLTVPRLMKILTPQKADIGGNSDEISDRIERYTLYLLNRNFWIFRNICLKRSLIFYHFLRKYGIPVTLCFGVRYTEDPSCGTKEKKMEGHAWLLYKGDMFLEKNVEETKTYTMTYCYPEPGAGAGKTGLITDYEGLR